MKSRTAVKFNTSHEQKMSAVSSVCYKNFQIHHCRAQKRQGWQPEIRDAWVTGNHHHHHHNNNNDNDNDNDINNNNKFYSAVS